MKKRSSSARRTDEISRNAGKISSQADEKPIPISSSKIRTSIIQKPYFSSDSTMPSSTLGYADYEDIDEHVKVGEIFNIFMPSSTDILIRRRYCSENDRVIYHSASEMQRRSMFSRNSPFRSLESINLRSNIKKFLAPTAQLGKSLSLEIGPPKLLLVEDNSVHRDVLQVKLLEVFGWEPDVACNGEEAVQKYKLYADLGYRYTAIFMDTTMPVMDGYTATTRIRALELENTFSSTLIIGILGSFEMSSEKRCLDAGMNSVSKM